MALLLSREESLLKLESNRKQWPARISWNQKKIKLICLKKRKLFAGLFDQLKCLFSKENNGKLFASGVINLPGYNNKGKEKSKLRSKQHLIFWCDHKVQRSGGKFESDFVWVIWSYDLSPMYSSSSRSTTFDAWSDSYEKTWLSEKEERGMN